MQLMATPQTAGRSARVESFRPGRRRTLLRCAPSKRHSENAVWAMVQRVTAPRKEDAVSTSDILFEPLTFPHLTVANRVFRSSISGRFDNYDGSGTHARINWEEKFAR